MKKLTIILFYISTIYLSANIWQKVDGPYDDLDAANIFSISENIYVSSESKGLEGITYRLSNQDWERVENSFLSVKDRRISELEQSENLILLSAISGIFRSTDYGETWDELDKINNTQLLSKILIVDDIIFTLPSDYAKRLFYSDDLGNTWQAVELSEQESDTLIAQDIAYDGQNLYATQKAVYDPKTGEDLENILFISSDKGKTWSKKLIDYPIEKLLATENYILGNTAKMDSGPTYRIIRTTDKGNTWKEDSSGYLRINCWKEYNDKLYLGGKSGFYITSDSGKTFQQKNNGFSSGSVEDIVFHNGNIYINNNKYGIFKSEDNGESWSKDGPLVDNFRVLSILENDDTLFTTGGKKGIQFTTDNGKSWQTLNKELDSLSYRLGHLVKNKSFIIASWYDTRNGNIYISTDNGKSWREHLLIEQYSFNRPVLKKDFIITDDNTAYINTIEGIKISTDFGYTWETLEDNLLLPEDEIIEFTIIDDVLYAGKNKSGIVKSTDNGENWEWFIKPDSIFNDIHYYILKEHNGNLFLTISRDNYKGILRSTDNGKSWEMIIDEENQYGVISDYIFIESYIVVTTEKGVILSRDNGNSWEDISYDFSEKVKDSRYIVGQLIRNKNTIVLSASDGLYKTSLDDLGIVLNVENNTEKRNYLYINPPFPQPAREKVSVDFYWDTNLPMSTDDIKIYNIYGSEVYVSNDIEIHSENSFHGILEWDCSNVNSGIYLIEINHGTETRTVKVMVTN